MEVTGGPGRGNRHPVPAGNPVGKGVLSPREREILGMVADGKSTRQIAAELGIAFKTAACHRANLMAKLDVHDTATLVRRAIRSGLIEP